MPADAANSCSSSKLWSLTRWLQRRPRCHQRGSSINTAIATYDHTVTAPEAELRAAWCALAEVRPRSTAAAPLDGLLARLREPHRHYHTATHVMWVLRRLGELAQSPAAGGTDLGGVRWAALYHDAIYDPTRSDNEALSAELAAADAALVGWDADRCAAVHRLVMATATHCPSRPDEALLVDADLAVLGGTPAEYEAYVRGVRAEYAHVEDAAWRLGRADVLRRLLAGGEVFHTAEMRTARGARAVANLSAELATLEAG